MLTAPRHLLVVLALTPLWAASLCSPDPGPDPCELDRLGCEDPPEPTNPDDFYLDTCPSELAGPLDVVVGSGERQFAPFTEAGGPTIHFGPQGGQHVFMALQVRNARLDASPRLRISYYLGQGDGCAPPSADLVTAASCPTTLGRRNLTLGGPGFELRTGTDGSVEEYGIVVFVEVPNGDLDGLIALTVEDQCRRSGVVTHVWTEYFD
jgi:hypothetical protein